MSHLFDLCCMISVGAVVGTRQHFETILDDSSDQSETFTCARLA